ncbi:MAG TPA: hypothetical protein VK540_08110 [Polyangiaceae bacterium]|nr:hypothetical protein [Polyangiaceae bacterium]
MSTTVTLYADGDGELSFYPSVGARPVPFELADGYRLEGGLVGGRVAIFGPPGKLGLRVDEALTAGVLKPAFDERLASVDRMRYVLRSPSGRYVKGWSSMGLMYGARDEAVPLSDADAKRLRGFLPDGPDLLLDVDDRD